MGQRSANGAARADGPVGNPPRDILHHAPGRIRNLAILEFGMANGRPDGHGTGRILYPTQGRRRSQPDHGGRAYQAQVQHRPQGLAAGHHLDVGARQLGQHLVDGLGGGIIEIDGLHATASEAVFSSARIRASRIRSGVAGMRVSSTPRSFSASLIALTMAPGGAIAPPSPTPFMPWAE